MRDLPRVGEEFAGYRLGPRLGRGGMSVVYQAENWRLGNVVALKILAPELANDDQFRTRFLQESRVAASLNHPNVVPVTDFGACDGLLYLAMRYVAGIDLGRMIAERGRLDPGTAVHLLSQGALALDAAHRRGLVHRDVKPANLLVERTSDDTDPDHLYLADFGITKHVGGLAGQESLTAAGMVVGTARYVSPEQAQELAVHGAADQYALGCVLFECLTGRVPFDKNTGAATVSAHVREAPPRATALQPGLPPAIDAVFARVLAKEPGARYPDCRAFMAAAGAALETHARLPGRGGSAEFGPGPFPPDEGWHRGKAGSGELPVTEPWRVHAADDGTGGAGRGAPTPRLGVPSPLLPGQWLRQRRNGRVRWGGLLLAILAAAGTAAWVLATGLGSTKAPAVVRPAAAASSPSSALFAVLTRTAESSPGDLNLSACQQPSATDVECKNLSPAIASVSFVTYPSLPALYSHYQEIVSNLAGHQPFAAVENSSSCGWHAPHPAAESTWNGSDQYFTTYSVAQLMTGAVPSDIALGRVFCTLTSNGDEDIVWTQDAGDFLGYATGAAPDAQVWDWFADVHHGISCRFSPAVSSSSRN